MPQPPVHLIIAAQAGRVSAPLGAAPTVGGEAPAPPPQGAALLRAKGAELGGRAWRWLALDFTGLAVAGLFFAWSMTPSLLPRDWAYQGLISGISLAAGYGTGTLLSWFSRSVLAPLLKWRAPRVEAVRLAKFVVGFATALLMLVFLLLAAGWQREIAVLVNVEGTTTTGYLRTGLISILVAAVIVACARAIRVAVRVTGHSIRRLFRLPEPVLNAIGIVLVSAVLITLVDGVLVRGLVSVANSVFSVQNELIDKNAVQPWQPERSGSPLSLVSWDSLGRYGRNFTSSGLTEEQLETVNGRPAREPVRVYAGLDSAPTMDEQMSLVVRELERAGAFDREVLVVTTTTGTGWINENVVQALELMYNGDTAFVATQYSYLPSPISFLVDRPIAQTSGEALFDAVHRRWLQEPAATRPRLYVYGESLGSFGSEAAFSGLAELRAKVDGALWVGPTNWNGLWQSLVSRRDPGSPQIRPTYAGGLVVRFANRRQDLEVDTSRPWLQPRVLYLQHPSDPVVWWSPDLLLPPPDWLEEPRGYDVAPSMRWRPVVTFWQVAADLANAASISEGHGHLYGLLVIDGWAAIAPPEGWTAADTARVRAAMNQMHKYQNEGIDPRRAIAPAR